MKILERDGPVVSQSLPYRAFSVAVVPDRSEVVVAPDGELDMSTADEVARVVRELRASGFTDLVIDLRSVDFIDSSGLRMLLRLRSGATRDGHSLALVPPPPLVRRVFELTGTLAEFDWRGDLRAVPT